MHQHQWHLTLTGRQTGHLQPPGTDPALDNPRQYLDRTGI
jgi:hypothetical protein